MTEVLWDLSDWIDDDSEEPRNLAELVESYPAVLLQEIDTHLVAFWSAGATMRDKGIQATTEYLFLTRRLDVSPKFRFDAERAAWLQGVAGKAFDWRAALERTRAITLQAWAEADAREAASTQAST